ncbi:MAG TPA: 8-amino-7-oxononanoate synthase, partial [Candidatus Acidoferrum sp.]|nr:8-amino-7-oxononanoate synthase [Candidatus Acidoferrum sp.]
MSDFDVELHSELEQISQQGLRRELRRVDSAQSPRIEMAGRKLLNFSSNDYLGLANHPALKEAAIRATEKFGSGSGSARLVCGSLAPHHELEEALAVFKGTEAALTFSSGYATALGTIQALAGRGDVVVLDKLVHASIVDAVRLSGATLRVFKHNDLADLERILKWAREKHSGAHEKSRKTRVLVVTESVFSMDGDLAPLRDIVTLKEKFGAWLMVDEAHATGLFGETGRGLGDACGVADQIEVQMGTLGKSVGSAGGYICGSRALIDLLVNRARSFIFSTAPTPAQSSAARAGIELLESNEGHARRAKVWAMIDQLKNELIRSAWPLPVVQSAIVPLIVGGESDALQLATRLREDGVFVPAIRFPTVARDKARLRVTLTADHEPQDVKLLVERLNAAREAPT